MENSYAEMNHLVSGELFSEKMDALTEAMSGGGGNSQDSVNCQRCAGSLRSKGAHCQQGGDDRCGNS